MKSGINGRGKSAILDGLSLLLSRLLPQVTPARGGYKYFTPQDVHQGESALRLSLSATFEDIPVDFAIDYNSVEGQRPTKLLPQIKREISHIYGNPQRAGDAAPIAVYYTTDRAAYRLPKRLLSGISQDQRAAYHGALFNRQIDFREFMSRYRGWADSIVRGEDRDQKNQRTINTINRAVSEFLPSFNDVRVELEPLRLLVSKQGRSLDLTQMSDGERSLLAMLIDLCRRLVLANPELDDPLQGAGVVLIDEIELHLHPQWQREILEKLRQTFPYIQFILTTHSPFVIQSAHSSDELVLLDAEPLDRLENKGVEEISKALMGIERPDMSKRYQTMKAVAKSYLEMLNEASLAPEAKLKEYEEQLAAMVSPYADNPAFQAFLEMKRAAKLGER
ncbi:MAG: AAA family ATPase [Proteobacteria bacterium]|nr:MAG: AAA family ATPase [Pseudomonadota bacterium]